MAVIKILATFLKQGNNYVVQYASRGEENINLKPHTDIIKTINTQDQSL